jgi:hypothetical protein
MFAAPMPSMPTPVADQSSRSRDVTESSIHPELLKLYRQATPEHKLAIVSRINASLQSLKAAQIAAEHPNLGAQERTRLLRTWWFAARD